jgi:hypothetical protein
VSPESRDGEGADVETLNRIEPGKSIPATACIAKIERAMEGP